MARSGTEGLLIAPPKIVGSSLADSVSDLQQFGPSSVIQFKSFNSKEKIFKLLKRILSQGKKEEKEKKKKKR